MESKKKAITVSDLDLIWKMTKKKFNATEISGILKRSDSSVQKYVKVLKAVNNGEPFHINPIGICMGVIAEYCESNSLSAPVNTYSKQPVRHPEKTEQMKIELSTPGAENIKKAVNMLNEIGISFHSLAEFLWENFCK